MQFLTTSEKKLIQPKIHVGFATVVAKDLTCICTVCQFFSVSGRNVCTGTWLAWKWKTLVAPETPSITSLLDLQGVFVSGKNCKSYENTVKVQNLSLPLDFPRAIQLDIFAGVFLPPGPCVYTPALYCTDVSLSELPQMCNFINIYILIYFFQSFYCLKCLVLVKFY